MSHATHLPDIDSAARLAAHAFARVDERESLFGNTRSAWRTATRAQLGLPLDVPIIVTGHQAGLWHAGIAEKFSYGARLARRLGGVLVHIIIDHDLNDASEIAFPATVAGTLVRLHLVRTPRGRGVNALRRPIRVRIPEEAQDGTATVIPTVAEALSRIESAIHDHASQPNLALQMAHAANALLPMNVRPNFTIPATAIARSPFASAMRAHFDAHARACYNFALGDARVRRLRGDELPFWSLIDETASREPLSVGASDALAAPRALSLTAIVRLVLCDFFVHGTGGAVYEEATDRWLDAWLGARLLRAPIGIATATRTIPLLASIDANATPRATAADLRRITSDPFGASLSTEKQAMLAEIAAIPRDQKQARRDAYTRMHRAMDAERLHHAPRIAEMQSQMNLHLERAKELALIHDRTWPFPFTLPATP